MRSKGRKILTDRRAVLRGMGALGVSASGLAFSGPGFAAAPDGSRVVLVLLRGGLDGLGLLVPYGEADYPKLRRRLALPPPGRDGSGVVPLDDGFGLNPAASPLLRFWREGSLALLPAVSTSYRGTSHFEAQAVLESGSDDTGAVSEGWLARVSASLGGVTDSALPRVIAVDGPVPAILQGTDIAPWRPSYLPPATLGLIEKTVLLYRDDPVFAPLLADVLDKRSSIARSLGRSHRSGDLGPDLNAGTVASFSVLAGLAGQTMARPDGPQVAVLQVGGWDTHFGQGGLDGRLSRQLAGLAGGLVDLADNLGPAWDRTVVVVVSEFGRTVAVNRTGGTGHGEGGVAMVLGGRVNGGRTIGDWPGIAANELAENGGLKATMDVRSIFKAVLRDHLGIDGKNLGNRIFPASASATPIDGLIKA